MISCYFEISEWNAKSHRNIQYDCFISVLSNPLTHN